MFNKNMKNKPKTDEQILAEMDEIDRLELEGGISAAPSRSTKKEGKSESNPEKASKDRASRFAADGPEDW